MSRKPYLLALDVGTTSIKAVLFDARGRMLAEAAEGYALETPAPDVVEVDPEVYWRGACSGVRQVLAHARFEGIDINDVGAVGVCSQGETFILLDSDGNPVRKAIVWLDNRADREADEFRALLAGENPTGQADITPTWPAAKLLWLRRHEPRALDRTVFFLLVEDYLLYRMTGERVGEASLYSSSFLLDIRRGRWWERVLREIGLDEGTLPRLQESGTLVGRLLPRAARELGLPSGCPVVTGAMDQTAAMIGAGNISPGIVTEMTGTAQVVSVTLNAYPPLQPAGTAVQVHGVPDAYTLSQWCPAAGISLRWLRDTLYAPGDAGRPPQGAPAYDTVVGEALRSAAAAEGLFFFPYMSGPGTLPVAPALRGVYWGLQLRHGRPHLLRALLESTAFVLREHLDIFADAGIPVAEIRAIGGGARSAGWNQLKADVTGLPVRTMACPEASALGVAILEGVALGLYSTISEAVGTMAAVGESLQPEERETERYAALYGEYLSVRRGLSRTAEAKRGGV